jgi:heme O synthase-like polyprenyltransferase
LLRIIPGTTLILACLLLSVQGYDVLFLAIAGMVAIGVVLLRRGKAGEQPEKDERANKLGAFGLAYSYLVSLIVAMVLSIAVYLEMADLNTAMALQNS